MSVVLVTGARGFIGRHTLARLAAAGFEVHGVGRSGAEGGAARMHAADLLDATARRRIIATVRPTHLLHLAWETRHGYYWNAPENLDWAGATLDLVRNFAEAGGTRAVIAGTCAEYDWACTGDWDGVCREYQTPLRPRTLYGAAKNGTREILDAYSDVHGLAIAWARLFFVYGPGEPPGRFFPSVLAALSAQTPIALGSGSRVRDFIFVEDAAAALVALLRADAAGPVNIGSGVGVSLQQFCTELAWLMRRSDAVLGFGRRPPEAGDPPRLVADVRRLAQDAGFYCTFPLERVVRDVLALGNERAPLAGR